MGTQKIVFTLVGVVTLFAAFVLLRPNTSKVEPLRFCTWSNYYPESFIEAFTQKTGIPVELSYISSNEELLAKFKAGATGFDLIQPSDYLVGQMIKMQMLLPLDHTQLTNLHHIDDYYRELSYDRGMKYSVPFTWGTTGIAINTDKVKLTPGQEVGWEMLLQSPDPKHTSFLDDMREVFGAVLMWRGNALNTTDPKLLDRTKNEIAKIKSQILLFSSEPRALLGQGEVVIAHIFSSDAVQASKENPKIRYFIPKEGATIYTDNFSIPKSSKRWKEAHQFINHFLDPQVAAQLAVENNLATPNRTVMQSLPAEIKENPAIYPPAETMKRLHFLEDIGESISTISRMWTELKSS